MIFIVGYKFQFNNQPKIHSSSISIQEQINLARRNLNSSKTSSIFDSRFINGNIYRISLIQKTKINNEIKIKYLFSNLTDDSKPDIDLEFSSTSSGDDYIAAISNNKQQLLEERKNISNSLENGNDF